VIREDQYHRLTTQQRRKLNRIIDEKLYPAKSNILFLHWLFYWVILAFVTVPDNQLGIIIPLGSGAAIALTTWTVIDYLRGYIRGRQKMLPEIGEKQWK